MDYAALLEGIAKLGPSVAAVLAIAVIAYFLIQLFSKVMSKLLDMFDKHTVALGSVERNMDAHTLAINRMSENVDANTKATLQLMDHLGQKR